MYISKYVIISCKIFILRSFSFSFELDLTLDYTLTNYTSRFSYTTYGGIAFSLLTGFEQVTLGNITTYYLFDWGAGRAVIYNQYWVYQKYVNVVANTYSAKCLGNYLYLSSNTYFYKSDFNLNILQYSPYNPSGGYRAITYDSVKSLFYVGVQGQFYLTVFNLNLAIVKTISSGGSYDTYGTFILNNNLYVGTCYFVSTDILVYQNDVLTKMYDTTACPKDCITSFYVDYKGNMAIVCYSQNYVALYDPNGNYLNIKMPTPANPFIVTFDNYGRLILTTLKQLSIYY